MSGGDSEAKPVECVRLTFPFVPNLERVGGNARHGHWADAYRAFQEQKQAWYYEVRRQLIPPMIRFQGLVQAKVTIYFTTSRARDIDNLHRALKPLWDALKRPSSHPGDYGWGIIEDDDIEHLEVAIECAEALAAGTVVDLTGRG